MDTKNQNKHRGHFRINFGIFQKISVDFNRSPKGNNIKIIFFVLLITLIHANLFAQGVPGLHNSNSQSFNNDVKNFYTQPYIFDRLSVKLNNYNSLFKKRTFRDLENYFQKEIVYYSINNRLSHNIVSRDYSSNTPETKSDDKIIGENYLYDLQIYQFSNYFLESNSFFDSFIKNVERNQFFYDMDIKHNDIYTNEFSILEFQSPQANQYIQGTKVWGGAFVGMFGVLMLMPRSVTKWEDGYIDDAMSNLNRAFTEPPVWDEDHWEINYIGHPYAGSLYYNTIRAQGGTVFHSFLFSAFISTGWEYVYEGVAERPSIQDLIVTPVAGAILGEIIHQATLGMKKNGFSVFEAAFVTVLNPMYVILNGYH